MGNQARLFGQLGECDKTVVLRRQHGGPIDRRAFVVGGLEFFFQFVGELEFAHRRVEFLAPGFVDFEIEIGQWPRRVYRRRATNMPAPRPGEHAVNVDAGEIDAEHFDAGPDVNVHLEAKTRHQINNRVKFEAAFERRNADIAPHSKRGAALHRRRGDREITLEAHADDADGKLRADALEWCGNIGWNIGELRVKTARAQQECGLVAEQRAKRELAGQRNKHHARITQHAIQPELQWIEHHAAGDIHLQIQQRERFLHQWRQLHNHLADDDNLARFDQYADARRHQARCAPTQFQHRADDKTAGAERENRAQLVNDLRRVGDGVLREQEAVERAGGQPRTQGFGVDGVLHAEQAADASHGEAETQLDRRQLRGNNQQQRPATRVPGRQQADGLDADLHQLDVEDAAVFAARRIEQQETAALDDAGIDGQTCTRRRLQAPRCNGIRAPTAQHVGKIKLGAEPVDRTREGADGHLERARDFDIKCVKPIALDEIEIQEWYLHRTAGNFFQRYGGLQPRAVFQTYACDVADQAEAE